MDKKLEYMDERVADAVNFVRAARDFHNAGSDQFTPGYDQYGDLLDCAEVIVSTLSQGSSNVR